MTTRNLRLRGAALLAAVALAGTAACGSSDDEIDDRPSETATSAASESSEPPSEESGPPSEPASEGAAATETGRESIPSTQPTGFTPEDTAAPFAFGHIVEYVNQYPGWIVLSTELPEYDAALGGYVVNVYFSAYGGSDIILRSEFTMEVDGQVYQAAPAEGESPSISGWLPDKTPIGNRPDATSNYAFGDLLFVLPETASTVLMKYNNVDGDVHITWSSAITE